MADPEFSHTAIRNLGSRLRRGEATDEDHRLLMAWIRAPADLIGRGIRYGGTPSDPLVAELHNSFILVSDIVAEQEASELNIQRLTTEGRRRPPDDEFTEAVELATHRCRRATPRGTSY